MDILSLLNQKIDVILFGNLKQWKLTIQSNLKNELKQFLITELNRIKNELIDYFNLFFKKYQIQTNMENQYIIEEHKQNLEYLFDKNLQLISLMDTILEKKAISLQDLSQNPIETERIESLEELNLHSGE